MKQNLLSDKPIKLNVMQQKLLNDTVCKMAFYIPRGDSTKILDVFAFLASRLSFYDIPYTCVYERAMEYCCYK